MQNTEYIQVKKTGSPRVNLVNMLKANDIYSEFPRDWFTKIIDEAWYYFSEELLQRDFNLWLCTYWKTSWDFKDVTWYSRPKINTYLDKYRKVFFFTEGYYNIPKLREFIVSNMKEFIERRWRPSKKY